MNDESVPYDLEEKLWAKLPGYYNGKNFIRLIPFKDYINIFANNIQGNTFTSRRGV